jgi:hypothetical protein
MAVALRQYGREGFTWVIFATVEDKNEAIRLTKQLSDEKLSIHPFGYNVNQATKFKDGTVRNPGIVRKGKDYRTEEGKARQRSAASSRKRSEQERMNLLSALKRPDVQQKISDGLKKANARPEVKEKRSGKNNPMSKAMKDPEKRSKIIENMKKGQQKRRIKKRMEEINEIIKNEI